MKTSPELLALLEKARTHVMTPAERIAQKRSWVLGEMMLEHPGMSRMLAEEIMDRVLPELGSGRKLADANKNNPSPSKET